MTTTGFPLHVLPDRDTMGAAAARTAAAALRSAIAERGGARMIAAAAPSQAEVYRALATEEGVDWSRVTVLHMDEYTGLSPAAPQRFSAWIRAHLTDAVRPAAFHPIPTELGADAAIAAYAGLLETGPIDLVCLGIGVNGHIAFNEPLTTDLHDPAPVRLVALDEASRVQQVDDGCFDALVEVPTEAVTLTVPALLAARTLVCAVPGARKAAAVRALTTEPVGPAWPCTALRGHPRCEVYVDRDAAALLADAA